MDDLVKKMNLGRLAKIDSLLSRNRLSISAMVKFVDDDGEGNVRVYFMVGQNQYSFNLIEFCDFYYFFNAQFQGILKFYNISTIWHNIAINEPYSIETTRISKI